MTTYLTPLEVGFGHHGPPVFAQFIGGSMFLLFLLLLAGTFFLLRRNGFGPPWAGAATGRPWGSHSPEGEAKKILADRFAQGEISAEEFMERASVLNWTPGSDQWTPARTKRR